MTTPRDAAQGGPYVVEPTPVPTPWQPAPGPEPTIPGPATAVPDDPWALHADEDPDAAAPASPGRRRGVAPATVILGFAAAFAIGGVSFALGRMTATVASGSGGSPVADQAPANGGAGGSPNRGPGGNGAFPGGPEAGGQVPPDFGGRGGSGRFGPGIVGMVVEITADAITIELADGDQVQLRIDDATTFHAEDDATSADVQVGDDVRVQVERGPGRGNPGSRTATDITVTGD